jgi:spoIIIJ-associated protein
VFNVVGGNAGVLIGKRGQNLEAIQYLIDKIVNNKSVKRIRLQIDVEGYVKTRRENLAKLATKLAEKTKKTGKPSTIGQISAQDRRTVHITLKSDKEIRTQSIGDGYYRKLVIFPRKSNYKRKKYNDKITTNR